MPLIKAYALPHPPIIIPEIGKWRVKNLKKDISSTIDAYEYVAQEIAEMAPDTIIIISPHAMMFPGTVNVSGGASGKGDFGRFGAKQVRFDVEYDRELFAEVECLEDEILDHGVLVPLYYIETYYTDFKLVRVSVSDISVDEHYDYGVYLRHFIQESDKRVVVIGSGDLSHKLSEDGPYGYAPEGEAFDDKILSILTTNNLNRLIEITPEESEKAAECGLRAFAVMAGMLDGDPYSAEFLSYEGPFGVGYAICSYSIQNVHVLLAKYIIMSYVKTGDAQLPPDLPQSLLEKQAAVFVTIKKQGELRGCIGTTYPTQKHVAMEIAANAISAASLDPRFPPVTAEELPYLSISVDVLSTPERIESKHELDVKKYGLIVSCGTRRGLLLPNLQGIDDVGMQLTIAMQKAGIRPTEEYVMERFEVERFF
jgi:AmmeMemoRadiSam system protein A/AmmeMemoRadiSam system protein B